MEAVAGRTGIRKKKRVNRINDVIAHCFLAALMAAAELAKGVQYEQAIKTGWRPPRYVLKRSAEKNERIRRGKGILAEGEDIPPPLRSFLVNGRLFMSISGHSAKAYLLTWFWTDF